MAKQSNKAWSFAVKIVAPVVGTGLAALLLLVGFMSWSAARIDVGALELQKSLAAHMVTTARADIADIQADNAGWDDAVAAIRRKDIDWINTNMGVDGFQTYGFDRVYVLRHDLKPIYAMRNGGKVAPSSFSEDAKSIVPLLAKLTSIDGEAAIAAYNEDVGEAPVQTDFGVIDGRLAVISAAPVLGATERNWVEAGDANFYVVIRFLVGADAEVGGTLTNIAQGHYEVGTTPTQGDISVPVTNSAGETLGLFTWSATRPAVQMAFESLPALGGVVLITSLLMARLLWRLRRATSELEQAREQAVHLALHDPLTGLANRAMFQKRLTAALETLNRDGSPIALLALDLDRFKEVNDRLGHEAGDELLRQVARRLMALLEDKDIVARLGGDEFVVLQNAIRTVSEARHLSERIIEAIGAPYRLAEQEVTVGVSIGVAIANDAARDGLDLPARADFALYQAKESGRNTYRLYETDAAPTAPPSRADAA